MLTRSLTAFALLLSLQTYAADKVYSDAELINVETKQGVTNSLVFGGKSDVQADNYTEVTVQLDGLQISARTYAVGGGMLYVLNHPEALIVGTTVQARVAKGVLEIQVPPKGKVLKFNIERMAKI